ncbi:hypothetical protein BN1723_009685 [Verticillium longisporum]|nr:hypothetical protein BN1723_009685 [Verticillium longisporum]
MHGAALYSCVDITFAEPGDERIAEVNSTNCFNSTDIGAADIYTITTRASGSNTVVKSGAEAVLRSSALLGWAPLLAAGAFLLA